MKNEENHGDDDIDDDNDNITDAKEKGAVRSSVSFSPEKEAENPWPLNLL